MQAGNKGVTAAYAYSFAKGLYVGLSVEAGGLQVNKKENWRFYGQHGVTVEVILCPG